jgi:hypothetical protein
VRQFVGSPMGTIDEQALLSLVRYNDLVSRFFGRRAYHLKGHVRKSVPGVGQAEVDDVHILEPLKGEKPAIVPVEAKAKDEPVNRAQIAMQIIYARESFPEHQVRPLTIKLFENGDILFIEFNDEISPAKLHVVKCAKYYFMQG